MPPVGIIAAMEVEAQCLSPAPGLASRRAGIGVDRARTMAREMLAEGCGALVSFGIAGGLDPKLPPGTVVLAESVSAPDGARYATDTEWREAMLRFIEGRVRVVVGTIVGSDRVVMTPAAKGRLFAQSGAAAVDMESHGIAEVAAESGMPFLVVRAISDPAWTTVPKAALHGMSRDGHRRTGPVIAALLRRPGELPRLIRLRRDSARGLTALRRVAALAGPRFGLRDSDGKEELDTDEHR